jgi:aryl-alcohol dehydrogenase-like predicted oxidoreductase
MEYRELGRTGWKVSTISFGAWAIGGTWGPVEDQESLASLRKAVDMGVNFFDTADVYGDGRSERLLGKLKKERPEEIIIATKAGRRLDPHLANGYNQKNLLEFVNRSLMNLSADALDLVQLHCPPTDVYYMPETFEALDNLVKMGKIRYYGVSVEKVEEALKAIEYPGVQSVQIIFNMFRQRPSDLFFREAARRKVGILARLPLSSGMLAGKMSSTTSFPPDDHRTFNRHGESFDRGETFSGIDYLTGLETVEEIRKLIPPGISMAQYAMRWILMFPEVSCAIPGAKRPGQVEENCLAADAPPLPKEAMEKIREIYQAKIKPLVHHCW